MIDNIYFPNPVQVKTTTPSPATPQAKKPTGPSAFEKILEQSSSPQGITFSRHAQDRLAARGIRLSDSDVKQLAGAVESVAQKGGKESLVMMGDSAFVVSVKNRTVVTALDRQNMQGNVFTNIDSAVFVK